MTLHSFQHACSLARSRAFTLIEVLIAVLILALGLLGLGSVFPVIISQQRAGVDATLGVLAAGSASSTFGGTDLSTRVSGFWETWRTDHFDDVNMGIQAALESAQGTWTVPPIDADGEVEMGGNNVASQVRLPVSQRLYPYQVGSTPQFVWDMAIHRKPDFDPARPDRLQMAVFVRKIDSRIRVPKKQNAPTLYQMVTQTATDSADHRVPVALGRGNRLTFDGVGNYAAPMVIDVDFRFDPEVPALSKRDRLYFGTAVDPAVWAFLSQKGQILVDNLGHVLTVESSSAESEAEAYLVFSPPMPRAVMASAVGVGGGPLGLIPSRVRQVVFTPHVPASVQLIDITE